MSYNKTIDTDFANKHVTFGTKLAGVVTIGAVKQLEYLICDRPEISHFMPYTKPGEKTRKVKKGDDTEEVDSNPKYNLMDKSDISTKFTSYNEASYDKKAKKWIEAPWVYKSAEFVFDSKPQKSDEEKAVSKELKNIRKEMKDIRAEIMKNIETVEDLKQTYYDYLDNEDHLSREMSIYIDDVKHPEYLEQADNEFHKLELIRELKAQKNEIHTKYKELTEDKKTQAHKGDPNYMGLVDRIKDLEKKKDVSGATKNIVTVAMPAKQMLVSMASALVAETSLVEFESIINASGTKYDRYCESIKEYVQDNITEGEESLAKNIPLTFFMYEVLLTARKSILNRFSGISTGSIKDDLSKLLNTHIMERHHISQANKIGVTSITNELAKDFIDFLLIIGYTIAGINLYSQTKNINTKTIPSAIYALTTTNGYVGVLDVIAHGIDYYQHSDEYQTYLDDKKSNKTTPAIAHRRAVGSTTRSRTRVSRSSDVKDDGANVKPRSRHRVTDQTSDNEDSDGSEESEPEVPKVTQRRRRGHS